VATLHDLSSVRNEFPECFWKRKIPADEHADLANRSIEYFMHVSTRSSEVISLGAPW
jgi:hypothetical protein